MTPAEAKEFVVAQLLPDEGTGEPTTFLGGLRPYRGVLPRRCFHALVSALRVLGPSLAREQVDRDVIAALWTLCELTRVWALDSDSMLRRNGLITEHDLQVLVRYHAIISSSVMLFLEGCDEAEALEEYELLIRDGEEGRL